ncbi:acyltransferase family protein [Persicirhabdus sediminis]|uniref:Acyltransferase n=1 Tax=Persicirhabdus sediminis TaxID=454144 RepID=A0A8J7MGM5_9BACT|nr:acyltransferase [Persicirhabdus sediminis]MBK1791464.1 acyltransferase [Persicirhabdus sediminis]
MNQMPQLHSLRAIAILLVSIHHWSPEPLHHAPVPYSIGVFLFFVLSGFLITQILLRGREKIDAGDTTLPNFTKSFFARRLLRIFPGFLVAIALYLVFGFADVYDNLFWYLCQASNFLFASTGQWSPGASQFWTLAIEQQFYLLWPVVLLILPRRWILPALAGIFLISPTLRCLEMLGWINSWAMPGKPTWKCLDYLAAGSITAVMSINGIQLVSRKLNTIYVTSGLIYLFFWFRWYSEATIPSWQWLQQSFLTIACVGIVVNASAGFTGLTGKILGNATLQHIGLMSYGLYLYHNLAPLMMGYITPFLWADGWEIMLFPLRLAILGGTSYAMARLSWKYIEKPAYQLKSHFPY